MGTPDEHPGVPYNSRDAYLSEPCHRGGKSLPLLLHTLLFCPFLQFLSWRRWELLLKGKIKKTAYFHISFRFQKNPNTADTNAVERQASTTTYLNLSMFF